MSQYRPDPFINLDGIQKIQQELGKLFEGDWVKPASRYSSNGDWSPSTDCIETESQWLFMIDLPGVALDDIDLSVLRGEIRIKGNKSNSYTGTTISTERLSGAFSRVLTLPEDADETTLAASMKNGVLSLSVNKSQANGARSIPIRDVS